MSDLFSLFYTYEIHTFYKVCKRAGNGKRLSTYVIFTRANYTTIFSGNSQQSNIKHLVQSKKSNLTS